LPPAVRTNLLALCDSEGTTDPTAFKNAEKQFCETLVKATVPSADQAANLAACQKPT
jgi:hypothetical protein